jgi:hypothetical protein
MYTTPTPLGRGNPRQQLSRPRANGYVTSPTLSSSSQVGRKSGSSISPNITPRVTPASSPESIHVGDTVKAPSGEVGVCKYDPPVHKINQDLWVW